MTHSPFTDLTLQTASALAELAEQIKKVRHEKIYQWELRTGDLSPEMDTLPFPEKDIEEILSTKSKYLYIFSIRSPSGINDIHNEFITSKKRINRSFCAISPERKTDTLYVGQSSSILSRIKEHLGYGASQTYSMQLAHWARPLNLHIMITCARYPGETNAQVLQHLEDTLWDTLLPILGKRGGR